MKRLLLTCSLFFGSMLSRGSIFGYDFVEYVTTDPYEGSLDAEPEAGAEIHNPGEILKNQVNTDDGALQGILNSFGIGMGTDQDKAFGFIRNLINYFLAIVGLIALIVFIYAFYKMFFGSGEDAMGDMKKLTTNTIIALFIIGFSRIITNRAFNLFYTTTGGI